MARYIQYGELKPVPNSGKSVDATSSALPVATWGGSPSPAFATGPQPRCVLMQARGGTVYWRSDGGTAADQVGFALADGIDVLIVIEDLSDISVFGGVVWCEFYY